MAKLTQKNLCILFSFLLVIVLIPVTGSAQEEQPLFPRDSIVSAARDIINNSHYCALVTLDSSGQPQARTMSPFPLNDKLEFWFATNRKSRKVGEIRNDSRISVYYADHTNAVGYVSITGKALIIDDKELLKKKKREYWDGIPGWQDIFVLIKIDPETMDVVHYGKGISGNSDTGRSPSITF